MADTTKFSLLRKILRAIGLSEAAVNELFDWITDRLADEQQETSDEQAASVFPYRIRDDFLSPAEHSFYHVLKSVVGPRLLICPKVSLSDLFFVKSSDPREYRVHTNKIDRKHVDFVLCDPQTLTPVAGIELDDKSHSRANRRQRDTFVEGVFAAAGLTLLRVRVQHGYQSQKIKALLEGVLPADSDEVEPITTQAPTLDQAAPPEPLSSNGHQHHEEKSVVVSAPVCPKCGSEMILRTAKKGNNQGQQFWGCPNYPRCRAVVAYEPVDV